MSREPVIVFIDDDQPILSALRREMLRLGVTAKCVMSREALFQALEQEHVTMVVSDLHMPEVFGLDLLEEVKQRYPGVLRGVLTGNQETDVILRSVNHASVSQFIPKPWDATQMSMLASLAKAQIKIEEALPTVPPDDRRARCMQELELTYPGITGVTRATNGAITVS